MKIKFNDGYLEKLAANNKTGKRKYPEEVEIAFQKRIFQIKQADGTTDLRNLKSLHFEKLRENKYLGKYSIRLNKAFRLIFQIGKDESLEVRLLKKLIITMDNKLYTLM